MGPLMFCSPATVPPQNPLMSSFSRSSFSVVNLSPFPPIQCSLSLLSTIPAYLLMHLLHRLDVSARRCPIPLSNFQMCSPEQRTSKLRSVTSSPVPRMVVKLSSSHRLSVDTAGTVGSLLSMTPLQTGPVKSADHQLYNP